MIDKLKPLKIELLIALSGILFGILYYFIPVKYLLAVILGIFGIIIVFMKIEVGIFAAAFLLPFIPTIATIALVLLIIASFIFKVITQNIKIKYSPLSFWLLLFAGILLFYSITSVTPISSLKVALTEISYIALFFVVINTINNKKLMYLLLVTIVASGALEALYGIYQYRIGVPTMDENWTDTSLFPDLTTRVFGTLDNPNIMAQYFEFLIPLCLGLFWYSKTYIKKAIFLGAGGLMLLCLMLTYSRGGWLALAISVMIFGILKDRRILVWSGIFGILSVYFLPDVIIDRISSIGNLSESSNLYRTLIWGSTIGLIHDFWYSGVGLGTDAFSKLYVLYMKPEVSAIHAHNLYLQMFAEIGIIGLLSFFAVLIATFKQGLIALVHSKDEFSKVITASLLGGLAGFLSHGISEYSFYNFKIVFLFWFIISLIMSIRMFEPNSPSLESKKG